MVTAWADFKAILIVRQPGTADLSATVYITSTKDASADLSATFDVGQNSVDLKGVMVIRHPATADVLGYFILINDTGVTSQGVTADVLQALSIIS